MSETGSNYPNIIEPDNSGSSYEINDYALRSQMENISLSMTSKGAVGDGVADDTEYFDSASINTLDTGKTFALDKETILNAKEEDFSGSGKVKYIDFTDNSYFPWGYQKNDGIFTKEQLSDELYRAMNMASEDVSALYPSRLNGRLMYPFEGDLTRLRTIGAIYRKDGVTLPSTFTLCVGKLKLFVRKESVGGWVQLKENAICSNVPKLYLEAGGGSADPSVYTAYEDYYEIELTDAEFDGNYLHFWGDTIDDLDNTDITHIAAAFDCWIKEESNQDNFVVHCGVDMLNSGGSITQSFVSRALNLTTERRTNWGHSVFNEDYDLMDSAYLVSLYDNDETNRYEEIFNEFDVISQHKATLNYYPSRNYVLLKNGDSGRDAIVLNPSYNIRVPYGNGNLRIGTIPLSSGTTNIILKLQIAALYPSTTFMYGEFIVNIKANTSSVTTAEINVIANNNLVLGLLTLEYNGADGFNLYYSRSYSDANIIITPMYQTATNIYFQPRSELLNIPIVKIVDAGELWSTDALTGTTYTYTL